MSIHLVRCRTHNRGERRRPFQVFQIQLDSDGKRVRRELSEAGGEIVRGPWEVIARPFEPGLYCMHCVNEGSRAPLPIDELDMQEAGLTDPPLVFIAPQSFRGAALVESLREKFDERIHYVQELPARDAVYADSAVTERLHPGLRRALRERIAAGQSLRFSG